MSRPWRSAARSSATHPDRPHQPQQPGRLYEARGAMARPSRSTSALALRREVLGERHPDPHQPQQPGRALRSQGRYGEAEPLYEQALALSREVLGEPTPTPSTSLNNLAAALPEPGALRRGRAALRAGPAALAARCSARTIPIRSPASTTWPGSTSQGRYGEAEPQAPSTVGGRRHPPPTPANQPKHRRKHEQHQRRGGGGAPRAGAGGPNRGRGGALQGTKSAGVRRGLVASQTHLPGRRPVAGDPEAELATLASWRRRRCCASKVCRARKRPGWPPRPGAARTRDLGPRGRDHASSSAVSSPRSYHGGADGGGRRPHPGAGGEGAGAGADQPRLQASICRCATPASTTCAAPGGGHAAGRVPPVQPVDFQAGALGAPHWAAVVVRASIGSRCSTLGQWTRLRSSSAVVSDGDDADARRGALCAFSSLSIWTRLETIVIAPDGALHLVPFHRLRLPDGRFWTEQVRCESCRPAATCCACARPAPGSARARRHRFRRRASPGAVAGSCRRYGATSRLSRVQANISQPDRGGLPAGFWSAAGERREVEQIAPLSSGRPDEPVTVLTVTVEASEASSRGSESHPGSCTCHPRLLSRAAGSRRPPMLLGRGHPGRRQPGAQAARTASCTPSRRRT